MTADERRSWITERLLSDGSIDISDIVANFGVSRMTVHRDLDELSRKGILRKERGGASILPSTLFESDVRFRSAQQLTAKQKLCAAALEWIEPGMAVMLDEATTTLPLIDGFVDRVPLTVISNFRMVLSRVAEEQWDEISLVALGGHYHFRFDSFTGPLCVNQVHTMRADLYITSTTAVDDGIAWHPDAQITATKQAMLAAAKHRLLLLDKSKLGRTALHRVAALSDFDAVLVDSDTRGDMIEKLARGGANVHRASVNGQVDAIPNLG